ncbi:MAG: tRNA lysidine(34) synthetase TilS [Gammaproteobacteria bacterium]|nr:tRNA lysidine(34) synthetase TilS [Gammaproteobacteria bacterium]
MSVTPQAFHFHLQKLTSTEKYLIAYSGGVDSHVLLHLCSQLKNSPCGFDQSFSAVYIDHGLSSSSKKWGRHCQHICFELDIPLTIVEVDGRQKKGQSPEASARTARYQAFSQLLSENECLLTAQHLDDQAETLLLQLLRGSGTKGLSAMPRVKPFSKGHLCRPILDYKKKDILDYAKQHNLQWIEDESNLEEHFDRNYLRQTILPLLEKRWPAVKDNFAKSAEVLAESQLLLDEMAESDLQEIYYVNSDGITEYNKLMLAPTLKFLSNDQQTSIACEHIDNRRKLSRLNNLLRYWINHNQLPIPSKKILEQIVHTVIQAREDAMPLVTWKRDVFHCEVRRYKDKLYLLDVPQNKNTYQKSQEFILSLDHKVRLNDTNTYLELSAANDSSRQKSFDRKKLLSKVITVRFRKGGERYRRNSNGCSHPLKHWFQEQSIPPWERETMPLIFWGDELIQVGHFIVNDSLKNGHEDVRNDDLLSIDWQRIENK